MKGCFYLIKVSKKSATSQPAKVVIAVSDVKIENGMFVDEEGNIAQSVMDALPEDVEMFEIKITIPRKDEDEE